MYYIYELREKNESRTCVYVGQSMKPKARLYDHTRRNPLKSPKAGSFYGQDLELVIYEGYETRAEARQAETIHKIARGLPPTERLTAQNNISKANAMRIKCPHCNMVTSPGSLTQHIKFIHPGFFAAVCAKQ